MEPQIRDCLTVETPHARLESGPIQFPGDRPGLYLAAEDARLLALDLLLVLNHGRPPRAPTQGYWTALRALEALKELIEEHVAGKA